MRRPWILAAAALLTACGAPGTASCSPCPGPGFLATGLPESLDHGGLRICVDQEPCTRTRLTAPIPPMTQQFVQLAGNNRPWESYDGTQVTVTITGGGDRWQGSGALAYTDGGDGVCSCSYLVADVAMASVSPVGSRQR